jgi:hypothetical protein
MSQEYRPQPGHRIGHAVPIGDALGETGVFGTAPGWRDEGLGKHVKRVRVGVCKHCGAPNEEATTAAGVPFWKERRDCCLEQAADYYRKVKKLVDDGSRAIDTHRANWKGADYVPPTNLLDQLEADQQELSEAVRNYKRTKARIEASQS